jgi:hypothetical protein
MMYKLATLAAPAGVLISTAIVAAEVTPARYRQISFIDDVNAEFLESKTIRQLVNPYQRSQTSDSCFQTIDLPPKWVGVSSDVILAQFLHEFFASSVFAPEALALRLFRPNLGEFSGERRALPIW